jgi:hypothetical protein
LRCSGGIQPPNILLPLQELEGVAALLAAVGREGKARAAWLAGAEHQRGLPQSWLLAGYTQQQQ